MTIHGASGASEPTSPGEGLGLKSDHMKVVWGIVFVVVALFGYGWSQQDVADHLLANEGVGEEGVNMMWFAAGYTAPLTVGVAVLAFLYLRGVFTRMPWPNACGIVAGVLIVCGLASAYLGVGLAPGFESTLPASGGPPIVRLVGWTIAAYLNTYGWPLAVAALALGCGAALRADLWARTGS